MGAATCVRCSGIQTASGNRMLGVVVEARSKYGNLHVRFSLGDVLGIVDIPPYFLSRS